MLKQRKKKFTFVLRDIDTTEIEKKYGIIIKSNLSKDKLPTMQCITKISDLKSSKDKPSFSFLDETHNICKFNLTMVDFFSKNILEHKSTGYSCFWCRHVFDTVPIGCPISYNPVSYQLSYFSEITREVYSIRKMVPKFNKLVESDDNFKDYYLTDGIFCSFNCISAFIEENSHNYLYNQSPSLLLQLYVDIFGSSSIKPILPAPSWRLLKAFGGHLTISEFRNSFNLVEFRDVDQIRSTLPLCMTTGKVYEEKTQF